MSKLIKLYTLVVYADCMSTISQQSCHTHKITVVALIISRALRFWVRDGRWVSLGQVGPEEKLGKKEGGSLRVQRLS